MTAIASRGKRFRTQVCMHPRCANAVGTASGIACARHWEKLPDALRHKVFKHLRTPTSGSTLKNTMVEVQSFWTRVGD